MGRDYGDPRSLYVDKDAPTGGVPHPDFPQVVVLDDGLKFLVCQAPPLPFADAAVSQIFAEHLIEHLTPSEGHLLCSEMRRVLRPGGLLRMSTPDLALFVEQYRTARSSRGDQNRVEMLKEIARVDPSVQKYVVGKLQPWTPSPAFLLNHIFRLWGHEWIYDADELTELLTSAGFDRTSVTLRSYRVGANPDLARLDLEYRRLESVYLEAERA